MVAKVDLAWADDITHILTNGKKKSGATVAVIRNIHCCPDTGDLCNRSDLVTDAGCLERFKDESPAARTCRNVIATAEVTEEEEHYNCRISASCQPAEASRPFVATSIEVPWLEIDNVHNCNGSLSQGPCIRRRRSAEQAMSVLDGQAVEGQDEAVRFRVALDGPTSRAVEVDYATADRTARAGSDYAATRGTLTFAPGETSKTVSVPVLDDAIDEGQETFLLRLFNARGARIADGDAIGTIANSDPTQHMWLSRFGRSAADHVIDAVSGRLLSGSPAGTRRVTLGGQAFDLSRPSPTDAVHGSSDEFGGFSPGLLSGWLGWDARMSGALTDRDLLHASSFDVPVDAGGRAWAAWGRLTSGGFDGEAANGQGNVQMGGRVTTGTAGLDGDWERWTVGIALSVSEGAGSYGQPGVDRGRIESSVTGLYPYVGYDLNDRVRTWGLVGHGTGDLTISRDDGAAPEARTDLDMRLFAGGVRGALLDPAATGGLDLALKADAFLMQIDAKPAPDTAATQAEANRLRFLLEGARTFALGDGGRTLTPSIELGLRYDGGDAETGMGVEAGGALRFADPGSGLSIETRARMLLAHKASGRGSGMRRSLSGSTQAEQAAACRST